MAISSSSSSSSSFFTSPNTHLNPHIPSPSISTTSVRFRTTPISAAFATADRTASTTETIGCFRNADSSSLYEVLGVGVGADTMVAYRRLARVLHPDAGSCESSADEFMKVHSAYATLVDPEKRAAYDRSMVRCRNGASSPVRFSTRRWETDQCW